MPQEDFKVEVARGRYDYFRNEHRFGHSENIGTTKETLWPEGGRYKFLDQAVTMTLSSTNTLDTKTGLGARQVAVYGLDADYNEVRMIVDLNGQQPATIPTPLLRIHRLRVYTAGEEGENKGHIYAGTGPITSGKPANIYGVIDPTKNQSLMAIYTVPAGWSAYIENIYFSVGGGFDVECELYAGCIPKSRPMSVRYTTTVTGNSVTNEFHYPIFFCEKTDIDLRASVIAGGVHADGGFELLLVKHGTPNNWSGS